ncbi:hypothetical protein L598_000100000890 [Mesorhizobium sp. J18]|nr:hypothetical protein L598_000100000890 [Mesorhizobium sp. J18]
MPAGYVEVDARRITRPGDSGGAVDRTAEFEIRADGIRNGQGQVPDLQRHVDFPGNFAACRDLPTASVDRDRIEGDILAAQPDRCRLQEPSIQFRLGQFGLVERQVETAILRAERTAGRKGRSIVQRGIGGKLRRFAAACSVRPQGRHVDPACRKVAGVDGAIDERYAEQILDRGLEIR